MTHQQKYRIQSASENGHSNRFSVPVVTAVRMSAHEGRIGGNTKPGFQRPTVTPKHKAWKKGRIIGQKGPLRPKQVWAIRARLERAGYLRDLALFNVAIESKLPGCDPIELTGTDLVKTDRLRERVSGGQRKTRTPVQFERTESTGETVVAWVKSPEMSACRFMYPNRFHDRTHISTRHSGWIVRDLVTAIGLDPGGNCTQSLCRTKAEEISRKTGKVRAVQLPHGRTKVDSTMRYLGVELEDALVSPIASERS